MQSLHDNANRCHRQLFNLDLRGRGKPLTDTGQIVVMYTGSKRQFIEAIQPENGQELDNKTGQTLAYRIELAYDRRGLVAVL